MTTEVNEIDIALECAMKVKKHLSRALKDNKEIYFKQKLDYVDDLLTQAKSLQKHTVI